MPEDRRRFNQMVNGRSGTTRFCVSALFCCFTTMAAPSAADEPGSSTASGPTASEIAMARQLFEKARSLEEQLKWADAADSLRQAIHVKDTPGLRYHLAYSEAKMGMLVEALADYDRAEELMRAGAVAQDVEALLGPARQSLLERLPVVLIALPRDVNELRLVIDDAVIPRSRMGQPIPLNPGEHRLVLIAPGRRAFTVNITFAEGERRTVEAILPPVSSRQPPPPGPIQDRGETSNTTVGARTWVLIGEATATLTFLGMGIGYSIAKSSANRRLQRSQENIDRIDRSAGACLSPQGALMGYCADLSQALDDRQRADNLATAGFAAAAVGAAATVLTWWLWPEPEKNHASLRVSLGVRPSGAGASLLTRF